MMPRAVRTLVVVGLAVVGAVGAVVPAGAQSTKADDIAKKYGLLRESDLPDGYSIDDMKRETGAYPNFAEVTGDCLEINPNVVFRDAKPVATYAAFTEAPADGSRGGSGLEAAYAFSSESDAKGYLGKWADGFDELADCGLMTTPSGVIGTYAALDLGKVGDQRRGVSFDPRTTDEFARLAVARDGKTVVYLVLGDDDFTDEEFTALMKKALKRAP